VVHLLYFVPLEAGWVLDWALESWRGLAVSDNIKPITIPTVFSNPFLIWCKKDGSSGLPYSFDLAKPELSGVQIQTGEVITQVFLVDIVNLTSF
jgi:hypothetical protein